MNVEILTEDQAQKDAVFQVEVKAYHNGSQLIPSAATITVKDPCGNDRITNAEMKIGAELGTLTYSLAAAKTTELWENAVIEISYAVGDVVHKALFFFDVVLQKLKSNVVDDDLKAYFPQLGDEIWQDEVSFAGQIEEAFRQIKRMIKDRGLRPAMLLDGSQIREIVIIKTLEMIFFNFAKTQEDIWWARFLNYKALFEQRFQALQIKYDKDKSGTIKDDETETFAQPILER